MLADPIITFDPANTSTNGSIGISSTATAVLLGGPGVNSSPDDQSTFVSPFSQGANAIGVMNPPRVISMDGNVSTAAEGFAFIDGDGSNSYHIEISTDAGGAAEQPTLPNGYGGGATASVSVQLYSVIGGLIPSQSYTLHVHTNLNFIAPPGASSEDYATTASSAVAWVGDSSTYQPIYTDTKDSTAGETFHTNLSDDLDLIQFMATAASMDFWVEIDQNSQIALNGPANLDDLQEASFTADLVFSVVPEPSSLCTMAIGMGILLLHIRRLTCPRGKMPVLIS